MAPVVAGVTRRPLWLRLGHQARTKCAWRSCRYAPASDEACALIREALTTSGGIHPGNGGLLIRLDPLTAPRRTQALATLCNQLTAARACYPGTGLVLRYEVKSHPSPA